MTELERLEEQLARAAAEAEVALLNLNEMKDREDRALRSGAAGRRVAQSAFSRIVGDAKAAGRTHQEALSRVAALKKRIKPLRMAASDAEHREFITLQGTRERAFGEHFLDVAREMLDPDVFTTLMREATMRKNRELIRYQGNTSSGSALGVRSAGQTFRKRVGE